MVTTETDHLIAAIAVLRQIANEQIEWPDYGHVLHVVGAHHAKALLREVDKPDVMELARENDRLELRNGRLKDALRTAQEGLLEMERVNNNLAADQEQHSDRDEVSAVITGQLADDLDRAEHEVYDLLTAVNFYRGLAINGTRINSVTDAAFLTALDIEL